MDPSGSPIPLERENLDVHVDLCQQRYRELEKRLEEVKSAVYDIRHEVQNGNQLIAQEMMEQKRSTMKVIVGTAGTIIAGLLSTIVVVLVALI